MAIFLHLQDLMRDPWTAESVRIFEGGGGIHGPLNRSEFLMGAEGSEFLKRESRDQRTADK